MKPWVKKLLNILIVLIAIIGLLIFYVYETFVPLVSNLNEFLDLANELNVNVSASQLTNNIITVGTISSTKQKFLINNRDIFTSSTIDYYKLQNYNEAVNEIISLTESEYAYLINAVKSNTQFVSLQQIDTVVNKINILGFEKTDNYERLIIKLDISTLIVELNLSAYLSNNLFLTITKNISNNYSIKINKLNNDVQQTVIEILNEVFEDFEDGYSIYTLSGQIFEECKLCVNTFCQTCNVMINIDY